MPALETSPTFLAEITIWDASLAPSGGVRVLRYASKSFTTAPSETPANAYYDPRISQPVDVTRNLFTGGNTSGDSITAIGDLVLLNPDGALDNFLDYGFDGRPLTIYSTTKLNPAYPADFVTVFSGTMAGPPSFDEQTVTIKVRDLLASLQLPFQTNKYGGTNVLPNGLDGVASDLQGKVKPVLLGKVGDGTGTGNFSPPCVNTDKLIYQISDGAISSVDAVYDKGDALNASFGQFDTPNWNTLPTSGNAALCYAFGAGVTVAGGLHELSYSTDNGLNWTSGLFGSTVQVVAIAFDAVQGFLAVGGGGNVYISPDGKTWTTVTPPTTGDFNACSFHNGVFVAGGNTATGSASVLFTSTTGATGTWVSRTIATGFDATAFGPTFTVMGLASSGVGIVAIGKNHMVMTSPDAVNWTVVSTIPVVTAFAVMFAGGVFVTIGATSTDATGTAWIRRTSVPANVTPITSAYSITGTAKLLMGVGGASYGWSYDNGVTWVEGETGLRRAVVFGNSTFVSNIAGSSLNSVLTATNSYSSAADLLDDAQAPAPGSFKVYPAGGYIRLGAPAIGTITCDATQGANAAARTAAQLFNTVQLRANASASVNASDLMTLDGLNSSVLGIWINDDSTFAAVLDQIAGTPGAGYWPSVDGQWRIKRIDKATGNPLVSFTDNDLKQPMQIVTTTDDGGGLPVYRCTVNWGQNYTVQTTDLATGVTDDRRAVVAQQWRAAVSTDLTVQTAYPLSPDLSKESLFTTAADAQTEADRWQVLMATQRYRYLVVAQMNSETLPLDLADEIELVNPRFGLESPDGDTGAQFIILDIQPSAKDETITYTCWGAGRASRNIVTDDGFYLVCDDGTFIVTGVEN